MHDEHGILGQRFLAYWKQTRRILIDESALWEPMKQARASGDLTDRMRSRDVMMEVLTRLEREGSIKLPSAKDGWDKAILPHVPKWIRLVGSTRPKPDRSWQSRVWHERLLGIVDGRRSLSLAQLNFLIRLDDHLKSEGIPESSGKRSRSLLLTGNEKALDDLMKTDVIQGIAPEILNVVDYPAPLCTARIGEGKGILIVENEEPFYAALEGLSLDPGPFGAVAYGRGAEVADSIRSLPRICQGITWAMYVGDLDRAGMTIMRRAQISGAGVGIHVSPAAPLYREMVERAEVMGYPDGWAASRANTIGEFAEDVLFKGLDADLQDYLRLLWNNDRRIPEEVLGPQSFRKLQVPR